MIKPVKFLIDITGHSTYLVGSTLFASLFLPIVIVANILKLYKVSSFLMYVSLAFFVRKVLGFLRVIKIDEIRGTEQIKTVATAVYVCNHRGKLDGPLIMSLVKNIKPTMKTKYARRPLFRLFVRWFGFCEIDLKTNTGLLNTEKKIADILKEQNILIFPEGTRKYSNRLTEFKNMAFKIAIRNNKPIVPVIIHDNIPFMTKNLASFFPMETVKYNIHFLAPVDSGGKTAEKLKNEVYEMMSERLREITSSCSE